MGKLAVAMQPNRYFDEIGDSKRAKLEKIIFSIALALCLFGYYAIYFNKAFPYAEGWHAYYAELIKAGNVPYRDFFYYLPPLNLVIDFTFWTLSFGSMLMFRIWRLLERIAMMQVVYFVLCRHYSARIVFLACLFGGIIAGGNVYDLLGDYNQTTEFLVVLIAMWAIQFAQATECKIKCRKIAVAGGMIGLTFLCKQSTGGVAILIYALFLCAWCFWNRDRNFPKYLLAAVLGILAPIALAAVILACFGALPSAIEQIFVGGSSKGSLGTMLFVNVFLFYKELFRRFWRVLLGLAILAALLLFGKKWVAAGTPKTFAEQKRGRAYLLFVIGCYALFALVFLILERARVREFLRSLKGTRVFPVLLFLALALALGGLCLKLFCRREKLRRGTDYLYTLAPVLLLGVGCALLLVREQADAAILNASVLLRFKNASMQLLALFLTGLVLFGVIGSMVRRKQTLASHTLVFAIGAFCSMYSVIMSSGAEPNEMPMRTMFFTLPVLFCILVDAAKNCKYLSYIGLTVCLTLCCLGTLSNKAQSPYNWWGYWEAPLYQKTEAVNIPGLGGYRFSPEEKHAYEQLYLLVRENTDEDDVVLGFPYVKIFNLLTDHIDEAGFVPVHFFDVCPDNHASEDAKRFAQAPPDLIIWQDLGEECWTMHEQLFRNGGRMGQRDIQDWFISVKDTNYEIVGQVGDLYVYKLKENTTPVGYRYFQGEGGDRGNSTARLPEQESDS